LFARAGIMAPGSRRVIVRARYSRQLAGDLGAAKAHLRYIQRDGITRDGGPGQLYDATIDQADGNAFLDRSKRDPHQFRFIVSPEDSSRLQDLKPFIRDLMRQMEQDLDTKLDWVAIDHFNTGHPHTHVVIRGRDDQGRDLVIARDYIGHGVRARAQALMTLELGPESELERLQKLASEVERSGSPGLIERCCPGRKTTSLWPAVRANWLPRSRPCRPAASRHWSGSVWRRSAGWACGRSMPAWRPSSGSSGSAPTPTA
jgi:hypothetical protein